MSFDHSLSPELQSAVFSFLGPCHTLSTCSHISRAVARAALSPACFRTRLFLEDHQLKALPTLSPAVYGLLTQATALDIQYRPRATKPTSRSVSSAASPRSLPDFSHLRSLRLRVRPLASVRAPPELPLATFNALFQCVLGTGTGGRERLLPELSRMDIGGLVVASSTSPTPPPGGRSGSTLSALRCRPEQVRELLQLDSLRALACWATKNAPQVRESAVTRGVARVELE